MNRRLFVLSGLLSGVTFSLLNRAGAQAASTTPASKPADTCLVHAEEISSELMGFQVYEHHHTLAIPISALIKPPAEGIAVRTSVLDQGSLDLPGLKRFLAGNSRFGPSLQFHSHVVPITAEELDRIATGEKDVVIKVRSPRGGVIHTVTFNAPRSAIIKVQRGRSGGKV